MIKPAQRMEKVHSDIRGPLYEEALRMQTQGIPVMKLNTGNPGTFGFPMPPSIREALTAGIDKAVPYSDLRGMIEAREAIARYHKGKGFQQIEPDDIYLGNGVSELANIALTALLNSGDELLMPTPCYTLWSNTARLMGGKPVFYRCDENSDWLPDVTDLKRKITGKTRGIVLINPNNPTGAVYPDGILLQIIALARENSLLIFSDEIYDRMVMDGVQHTSTAALAPDLPIITMNGLSKSHNICGFRAGWMVVSGPEAQTKDLKYAITKLAAMRLSAGALMQLVIPAALEDSESTKAMLVKGGRLFEQREAAARVLETIPGVSFVKNRAAFYLFPKFDTKRFHIDDDKDFCRDILHATNVLVIPGSGFEWDKPDHLRIVMLPQADELKAAMERIGEYLNKRAKS